MGKMRKNVRYSLETRLFKSYPESQNNLSFLGYLLLKKNTEQTWAPSAEFLIWQVPPAGSDICFESWTIDTMCLSKSSCGIRTYKYLGDLFSQFIVQEDQLKYHKISLGSCLFLPWISYSITSRFGTFKQ